MGVIQKQGIANTVISYAGIAIGFLNVLVLQPYMLTPEEIGLTRVLYSISTLIASIFPLGLNGVVVKYLPEYRNGGDNKGFLGFIIAITAVFFLAFSLLFLGFKNNLFSLYYEKSKLFWEFKYYVLPMSFFIGFSTLLGMYLSASFRSTVPTFINDIALRVFSLIITSLYFLKIFTLQTFVFLFVAGYVVQMLWLLIHIVKHDGFSVFNFSDTVWNRRNTQRFLAFALSVSLITIGNMAIRNIDILMIGKYLSLEEVAVYSIAILIASFIELPAAALGKIADGKIADYFNSSDWVNLKKVYYDSTRILMFVGCILFLLINLNITQLLYFLPPKYSSGSIIVNIVSLSALSNMCTGINSSMLLYTNKNKQISILFLVLLFLMISLNYFLIPLWGLIGAAIAVVITFTIFNITKSILLFTYFKLNPFNSFSTFVLVLSAIIYLIFMNIYIENIYWSICLKSMAIVLVFLVVLYKHRELIAEKTMFVKLINQIKNTILKA